MKHWDKTILAVVLEWGYGIPARGPSLEKLCFCDNLKKLVTNLEILWVDDYLKNTVELQRILKEKAQEVNPDLIFFIPYTDQFSLETLDFLKQRWNTYCWFGDDQWRFENFSSVMAPHFTFVSTTDEWSIPKYRKIGIDPILTQWAAQAHSENIGPLNANEQYEYDVSFVGGRDVYRAWFIDQLAKQGIHVECFGHGWPNGMVTFERMEQIFRKSRINLNISNSTGENAKFALSSFRHFRVYLRGQKNAEQIKARNFEIPLAGGFQLSNYVLGLEKYLTIGPEIAVYVTVDDCVRQIHYYLEQEELRNSIVTKSHQRALTEHTYLARMEQILTQIWKS